MAGYPYFDQLQTAPGQMATLGSPQAATMQTAPAVSNLGSIAAQQADAQRRLLLADALRSVGYVPNSGAMGALAQIVSAWKGKKIARKAGESYGEALQRKFDEENRIKSEEMQRAAAADEAKYRRTRGDQIEDRNFNAAAKLPSYVQTDQGPMVSTPQGLVLARYAPQGGQAAPQGDAPPGAPQGPKVPPMQMAALLSKFGGQMTSGYRSPEHNREVGGVANSQHMQGTGQDWVFPAPVKAQAKAFAEAQGYEVIDEGDHLHFELPSGGGGAAPGGPIRPPGYTNQQNANARADEALRLSREANQRAADAARRAKWGNAPTGMRFDDNGNAVPIPGAPAAGQTADAQKAQSGYAAMAQDAINYAAADTGIDQKTLSQLSPEQVRDLVAGKPIKVSTKDGERVLRKNGRIFTGAIMGSIPGTDRLANPDLVAYSNSAAGKKARLNNPTGPVSNADFEIAARSVFSSDKPDQVNADLIYQALTGGSNAAAVPASNAGPKVGQIEDGHRFKGGNPADPSSWEAVR